MLVQCLNRQATCPLRQLLLGCSLPMCSFPPLPLSSTCPSSSQELVDGLYYFRDHYFESHGVEDAGRKQQDVVEEMEKTLQQMGEIDGNRV